MEIAFMRRRLAILGFAILSVLLAGAPNAFAAPPGPTNPFHREFDVTNPPARFDEIVLLGEIAPGTTTPRHTTGGDQYITVIAGELTRRLFGATPAEKTYKAGDTLVEKAGEVQELANAGSVPARWLATIILPKGAHLTTEQQTGTTIDQLPTGLTVVYQARMTVDAPAAQFKVVQDELDFAPGAWVPRHTHGGQAFGLVLDGEFTDQRQDDEKKYKAGDSFVEPVNTPHAIGNAGTVKASFFGTILLPPGGEIITIQAPPAAQAPSTMPRTAGGAFPWMTLALAALILLCAGWWARRVRAGGV
jgi:quercetin dioxygenase-like cupin family protein